MPAEVRIIAFSVEMRMPLGQFDVEASWGQRHTVVPLGRWRRTLPPPSRFKSTPKAPPVDWVERNR